MIDPQEDIDRLLSEAYRLPYGPARVALCEEAVRLADTGGDVWRGFECRLELITAAYFGNMPAAVVVPFAWCLGQYDRHPEWARHESARDQLLWRFKWVIQTLCEYPQFPLAQIEETLADMYARHRAVGCTLHRVYDTERRVGMLTGDRTRAAVAFEKMARTPLDWLSESPACYQEGRVSYLHFAERYEDAVREAEPFLQGRLNCMGGSLWACAMVLEPLFMLGRLDEAVRYHRQGVPQLDKHPGFRYAIIYHLQFLSLTDNLARAVQLANKHLPPLLAFASPMTRLGVLTELRFLADRARDAGRDRLGLQLAELGPSNEGVAVSDLFDWADTGARALATEFDNRNGNGYYSQILEKQTRLKARVVPFPLSRRRQSGRSDPT